MTESRTTAKIVRFPGQGADERHQRLRASRSVMDAFDEGLEARRTGEGLAAVLARHPDHREDLLALLAVTGRVAASAKRARRTLLPPLLLPSLPQPQPLTRARASVPLLRLMTMASVGALFAANLLDLSTWLIGPVLWTAMLSWLAWWLDSQATQRPDAASRLSRRGEAVSA